MDCGAFPVASWRLVSFCIAEMRDVRVKINDISFVFENSMIVRARKRNNERERVGQEIFANII